MISAIVYRAKSGEIFPSWRKRVALLVDEIDASNRRKRSTLSHQSTGNDSENVVITGDDVVTAAGLLCIFIEDPCDLRIIRMFDQDDA